VVATAAEAAASSAVELELNLELDHGATVRRVAELARPEFRLIAASVCTLGLTSSVTLLFPYVSGRVLDMAIADPTGLSPTAVAMGLFGLTAVAGAGVVARSTMLAYAGNRIVARMRSQLFDATVAQELEFFDRTRTGDLVTRLSADTQMVQKAATSQVVAALRSLFMASGATALLLYTSPSLSLMSLGTLPPIFLAARYFGRVMKERQRRVQELLADSTGIAEEVFGNMRTVRQFAAEPHESERYGLAVDQTYREALDAGKAQAWFDGLVHVAANAAILGVLGYGGGMVISGEITAGELASFLMYSMFVAGNVSSLSSVYADMMRAVGASGRVFAVIDRMPRMSPPVCGAESSASWVEAESASQSAAANVPALSVEFQNVDFAYPLRPDMPVLGPGFSLHVEKGEVLALVGGSGSGKSTVAALLTRLYDVGVVEGESGGSSSSSGGGGGGGGGNVRDGGAVLVGGIDVRDSNPMWLRQSIGVVAQEPILFATTIKENIRYGRLGASDKDVHAAALAANVLEFSQGFPDGLDTFVGQRGAQLSGGQKQRVAVARAILKNPPIVVLDEATSALDAESEQHVQKAIETVMDGRTVVSIAHRLSTVRSADRIAVLSGGRIVETGTFDELRKDGTEFHKLMARQLT
jgi:ABC-type multidrug transport system fused ATPase/permease subunit